MNTPGKWIAAFAVLLLATPPPCEAVVEAVAPVGGEAVALLPAELKTAMAPPTLESRLRLFANDKAGGKALADFKGWRAAVPLVLKWRATSGETSPWMVEIGREPDFSDARRWFVEKPAQDGDGGFFWSVPNANLEIGRDYRWRVTTRGRCGPGCTGKGHGCEAGKALAVSPAATFRTEDVPPRWIKVGGGVENFRDLGGWRTADGRRVRQGLVFRGQQLNIASHFGTWPGRTYLGMEDVKYLTGTLGIRTDLDLRNDEETAGLTASPLGAGVRFVQRSSPFYAGIFKEEGKKTMAENFRLFCDRRNYPIYIHCAGGADRTGSLAYVLLGVLGVDRHGIETDWEATFYPDIPDGNDDSKDPWRRESHFNEGFAKYGAEGDGWNRRIELYLLDCGVTKEEISAFRNIMLEKVPATEPAPRPATETTKEHTTMNKKTTAAACAALALAPTLLAGNICTWQGGGGKFSDPAKWDVAPKSGNGDTLVFDTADGTAITVENDLADDFAVSKVRFATKNENDGICGKVTLTGKSLAFAGNAGSSPAVVWENGDPASAKNRGAEIEFDVPVRFAGKCAVWVSRDLAFKKKVTLDDSAFLYLWWPGAPSESMPRFKAPIPVITFHDEVYGPGATLVNEAGRGGGTGSAIYYKGKVAVQDFKNSPTLRSQYMQVHLLSPANEIGSLSKKSSKLFLSASPCLGSNTVITAVNGGGYYEHIYVTGGDVVCDRIVSPANFHEEEVRDDNASGKLTMRASADGTSGLRFTQKVSLVWDPRGAYTFTLNDSTNTTSGTLEVKGGTFKLKGTTSFSALSEVIVRSGATLDLSECTAAAPIAATAKRTVDAGGTIVSKKAVAPDAGAWRRIRYPDYMKSWPQLKGAMLGRSGEQEFIDLHDMGATLVRYQMHANPWGVFTNSTDDVAAFNVWLDKKLDHLEEMLPWARKYGIRICVDMHTHLGGSTDEEYNSDMVFADMKYADLLVATWEKIARRFKGNEDAIYGYDLFNEPIDRENKLIVISWRELFCRTIEAIRAIDPVTPIVVEPNCNASPFGFDVKNIYGLSGFEPLPYDNLIYSVHVYQPLEYTHQGLHKRSGEYEPRPWPGWSRKLDPNRVRYAGDISEHDPDAAGTRWDKEYVRRIIQSVRDFQLRTGARILVGEFSAAAYAPGAERYLEDLCELFREYGWDWTYHAFREDNAWSVEHEGPSHLEMKPAAATTPRKAVLEKFFRDGTPSGGTAPADAPKAKPGAAPQPAERSIQGGFERVGGGRFRVLIYGNSIVFHGSHPPIGWTNNWGMAASAKEKDFAHLVVKGLEEMRGEPADYRLVSISGLEQTFATNAAKVAEWTDRGVAFEPDYVVIAVGENCGIDFKEGRDLAAFKRFLENLSRPFAESPKRPKIVLRSLFWPDPWKAKATKEVADAVGATYVDGGIGGMEENMAKGLFSNGGVAAHPNDLGMRRLADIVLEGFKE